MDVGITAGNQCNCFSVQSRLFTERFRLPNLWDGLLVPAGGLKFVETYQSKANLAETYSNTFSMLWVLSVIWSLTYGKLLYVSLFLCCLNISWCKAIILYIVHLIYRGKIRLVSFSENFYWFVCEEDSLRTDLRSWTL